MLLYFSNPAQLFLRVGLSVVQVIQKLFLAVARSDLWCGASIDDQPALTPGLCIWKRSIIIFVLLMFVISSYFDAGSCIQLVFICGDCFALQPAISIAITGIYSFIFSQLVFLQVLPQFYCCLTLKEYRVIVQAA